MCKNHVNRLNVKVTVCTKATQIGYNGNMSISYLCLKFDCKANVSLFDLYFMVLLFSRLYYTSLPP